MFNNTNVLLIKRLFSHMKFLLAMRVLFGTQSDLLIEITLKFRKRKKEKNRLHKRLPRNIVFKNNFLDTISFVFGILVLVLTVLNSHRDSDAFTKHKL